MVGPLTMKLATLMYHGESSSKQKLQVCKQQQTASGNKNYIIAYNLLMVGLITMEIGTLMFHDRSSSKQKLQVNKQPRAMNTCKWCLCLKLAYCRSSNNVATTAGKAPLT